MVVGYIGVFTKALGEPVTVALIGGGSLVLAASAIALAIFVHGDLGARGSAAAAQLAARGDVMAAFFQAETVAAGGPDSVKKTDHLTRLVDNLQTSGLPVSGVQIEDGKWIVTFRATEQP